MSGAKKVLAIVGSYRKGGTVDTAVENVLAGAREAGAQTETIYLSDMNVGFCTNCRQCTQNPGAKPVRCLVHHDEMDAILDRVDAADGLVIGAPVNVGSVNAITQRFIERCIGYQYWPWSAPAPKRRNPGNQRNAVLVCSSAAPAFMNSRLFGVNAVRSLRIFAETVSARVAAVVKVGLAVSADNSLSNRVRRRARSAGRRLVR